MRGIKTWPRKGALGFIWLYQKLLSPFFSRSCRYTPSCSAYASQSIARYGLWAGGWMALARLCRCHPWGASGYDPAPEALPFHARWYMPWRYGRWRATHIDPATRLDLK